MNTNETRFLHALKASLENQTVEWTDELSPQDWAALFRLADAHRVLPMVYEAVYRSPTAQQADPQQFRAIKRRTVQAVMLQTIRTSEFLRLSVYLAQAGVTPCVVKGIVCRSLYPKPDCRMSGDEDVLIPAEQFQLCHEVLLAYGMTPCQPEQVPDDAYEVSYAKPGSPLYLEVHKSLFPPDSEAYGTLNQLFAGASERMTELTVQDTVLTTMGHTDHLLYLICHAFKHFLHSGFGVRQVCDIALFANAYGADIDWQRLLHSCEQIHAVPFAAALFRIGQMYLTFDPEQACYPAAWQAISVDETAMLEDMLASGIYGDASMSRKHSSNMTLDAVSADQRGKKAGQTVLKSLFPAPGKLERRYPYLKKHPYLVPAAWADRLLHYRKEIKTGADNQAMEAVRIGNRRIALLRQYGIIK